MDTCNVSPLTKNDDGLTAKDLAIKTDRNKFTRVIRTLDELELRHIKKGANYRNSLDYKKPPSNQSIKFEDRLCLLQ